MYHITASFLPDGSLSLWHDTDGAFVGVIPRVGGAHPATKALVREHYQLSDGDFRVQLRIPRPPYAPDGARVIFHEEDKPFVGVVAGWVDASVLVKPAQQGHGGGGLFAPESLIFDELEAESG